MFCIFGIPCGVRSVSIPLLFRINTCMAAQYSSTQGLDGNGRISLQPRRSHARISRRTRDYAIHSTFAQITNGDTLIFNGLAAPAFLVGKVDFLPYPFSYDTTVLDLSRSLGSLDLEGREEPFSSDQTAERWTGREHDLQHQTDGANDPTDSPSTHWHDLPPSANTRSRHRQGSDGGGSPSRHRKEESRSFKRYGLPWSTVEINNAIKRLLLRRHAGADKGDVYGFQHPDDVAAGLLPTRGGHEAGMPHLIKIGRSLDHRARMRQISKSCGYMPHTVFAHDTLQHIMVERVVHAQLHNERLRGDGCAGCGARHEEWFQVSAERAEHLVALWRAFAKSDPYDDQGEMRPAWRGRLAQLDMNDADCWEGFVHGHTSAGPVAGSPQELEAETASVGLVAGHIGSSSEGNTERDNQEEA